jgi:DNA-binding CsgD family transcriptional regulator
MLRGVRLPQVLYGRDAERAEIWGLLEAARGSRSAALVLRGEPGIGKSALLEDARERAGDMHVLRARGIETESELPFAALHQLLRPALAHLSRLPSQQARALRGALALDEGAAEERFLVFVACLSLLSELAERRPVLCLVDDAHWLDTSSADALLFVARRLGAEGVAMLYAAREGDVRRFEAPGLPSLVLGGLDREAAATLLSRAAGAAAAPSVRDRLIEQSRGNALALVELPSALSRAQLAGEEQLPGALPLTRQVERVFLERVRRLEADAQQLLLVAAADDAEDAALVTRAAAELGTPARALDLAEQAGLITVHGNRLEFRHPLVRSAVYEAATSNDRREAHRALAEALAQRGDEDRRAWHLAASVLEPDEEVVLALEDAAARAVERAGHMAAAKALARAAELSTDIEGKGRRIVQAARAARIAGADADAVALAHEALPLVREPLLQAEIACTLGVSEIRRGRPFDGFPKLIEAARVAAQVDAPKALDLLIWAALAASTGGHPAALREVSSVAKTIAEAGEHEESTMVARALAGIAHALGADVEADDGDLEEALAWAATSRDAWHVFAASVPALFAGSERFQTLIDRAVSLARERGELGVLAEALTFRAAWLQIAHRFEDAVVAAEEAEQLAREIGAINAAARPLSFLAVIAAVRGDEDGVRRRTDDLFELGASHGLAIITANAHYALAMLDLGRGRWDDALGHLENVTGARQSGATMVASLALPNLIEAATRAGDLERAREGLASFEVWVSSSGAAWARPVLESCRSLVSEGEDATAHFEEALRLGSEARPLDLARIQLLFGEHLRRRRRRTDSRVHLRAALEGFERLRAEHWAERARTELRASGETARKRDPSTIDRLTPQELQIARLVSHGLSNKEVAAQLYLSPRTIDYHLRNVFGKLGLTSRTQLAQFSLGDGPAAAERVPVGASA